MVIAYGAGMKTSSLYGAVAALLIAAPAHAASITSEDFAAVLGPSAAYVAASSDLARDLGGRGVRAAAPRRAEAARALVDGLVAWRQDQARAEVAASQAPTLDHLGPIANTLSVPLEAVARTASAPGYFFTRLPSATRIDDASQADLVRLQALSGADFDAFYVDTDLAALRRLERVCRDFVLNGDDVTLRALAVHALPKLRREIAALERG